MKIFPEIKLLVEPELIKDCTAVGEWGVITDTSVSWGAIMQSELVVV